MKNVRRFTMIELLAVVAIIAILSTIGFGSYSYAMGKAKSSATEALMKQLQSGVERFQAKNGYYPQSNGEFNTISFTFASDGTLEEIKFKTGDSDSKYTELKHNANPSNRKQRLENEQMESFVKGMDLEVIKKHLNSDGVLEDAWGGKIYYCAPGRFNKGSYDMISAGPDGTFSTTGADTPTGITDRTKFRENAGDLLCDDIINF